MNDEGIFSSALQLLRKIGRIASFPVKRRSQAISDEVEPFVAREAAGAKKDCIRPQQQKYDAS